ncbi:hypothetical protein BMS3Abin17_01238 [archaeon BMS3Abin17]|nr:hypothetical protein BMS3Abin17_01238 [archaeon BMS3Abin17]HDZ60437.1 hypothetical protein [Candidatus Pacearchaeota archaeon]
MRCKHCRCTKKGRHKVWCSSEEAKKIRDELKKQEDKGCGKEVNPYKNIKIPCGDIAGGNIYYCEECELKKQENK